MHSISKLKSNTNLYLSCYMISPRLYHIVELYFLSEPSLSCFQINDINYITFI